MYCMDSLECHAKVYKHFKHAQSNHCDSAFYSRNAVEIEKTPPWQGLSLTLSQYSALK